MKGLLYFWYGLWCCGVWFQKWFSYRTDKVPSCLRHNFALYAPDCWNLLHVKASFTIAWPDSFRTKRVMSFSKLFETLREELGVSSLVQSSKMFAHCNCLLKLLHVKFCLMIPCMDFPTVSFHFNIVNNHLIGPIQFSTSHVSSINTVATGTNFTLDNHRGCPLCQESPTRAALIIGVILEQQWEGLGIIINLSLWLRFVLV